MHQPREVSIETLALCNAACTFCPYPTLTRHGAKLDDSTLLHLIEQMRHWVEPFIISPFKVNEPFLDKRLLTFCRWVAEDLPRARLRIFSNGSRFTQENTKELLELDNVEHIWVSLNETNEIRYKQLMQLNFNHVADKVDILHKEWSKKRNRRVLLSRVSEVDAKLDYQRQQEFETYCNQRWPGFFTFHIKRDGWIGYTDPSTNTIPNTPCARWWELSICATGDAALCCMDGTAEYKIGNVHDSSLLDIYNKQSMLEKRMGKADRQDVEPCKRCTY